MFDEEGNWWSSVAENVRDKETYFMEVSVVLQWNYCERLLLSLLDMECLSAGVSDTPIYVGLHFDSN
jgi:hypothetical protein